MILYPKRSTLLWHHNVLQKKLFWPLFNTITQEQKGTHTELVTLLFLRFVWSIHVWPKNTLNTFYYKVAFSATIQMSDMKWQGYWRKIQMAIFLLGPLQKSKDSRKGPVVILSITYRGVKFIDAATKVMGKYVGVSLCTHTLSLH